MERQSRQPLTQQEQLEMDIMAEAELIKLQRQYRIMDGDRKAFEDQYKGHVAYQQKLMNILKKENRNVELEIKVANSFGNRKKDSERCLELQRLLDTHDRYKRAIRKGKIDLKEIEYQIRKVSLDVVAFDRKEKLCNGERYQRALSGERTVESLENKLCHYVQRFCIILAENARLREEIDHMLRERALFNKVCCHYFDLLVRGKQIMMDLIEQATLAYDQREESGEKLQALRVRARHDYMAHTSEMRELLRQLDHDTTLQDFYTVKGQKRIMRDLEKKEQMKRQEAKENLERELQHYKETLAKVQQLAEEEDISKLSAQFIKQEEENFALFNYVNELNYELETLADNIEKLHGNIEYQKEITAGRAEQQRDTIEALRTQLRELEEEENQKKQILNEQDAKLQQLLQGIEHLFKMVRCDRNPLLTLLGDQGKISNFNVLLYLGILENRVTELMTIANYKDKVLLEPQQKRIIAPPPPKASLTAIPITPVGPCSVCAEQIMCDVNISDLQQPRNLEEIKVKMYKENTEESTLLHDYMECTLSKLKATRPGNASKMSCMHLL